MAGGAGLNVMTASDFDTGIPEYWEKAVLYDATRQSITSKFEGPEGSGAAIIRKDDPLKKAGDQINIITAGQIYNAGVTGATTLAGNEQKVDIDGFPVVADWVRNAVAWNRRAEGRALFNPSIVSGRALANWWARRMDDDMFYRLISTESPTNLFAGDATTLATLGTDDALGTAELDRISLELQASGAEPFMVESENGQQFPIYGLFLSEFDAFNLRQDVQWVDAQADNALRGAKNPIFTNALGMYKGIVPFVVPAGVRGVQGTPLRPECSITGSHTDSVTTITVGTNDGNDYTKNFASSGTIAIVNSSGARENVDYTGKTAYTFTGCTRGTTYGSDTSTASAYTGGEKVTQGNHESTVIAFGAAAACRTVVKPMHKISEVADYGFEHGIGVAGIYGQAAVLDTSDSVRNYITMNCMAKAPEAAE